MHMHMHSNSPSRAAWCSTPHSTQSRLLATGQGPLHHHHNRLAATAPPQTGTRQNRLTPAPGTDTGRTAGPCTTVTWLHVSCAHLGCCVSGVHLDCRSLAAGLPPGTTEQQAPETQSMTSLVACIHTLAVQLQMAADLGRRLGQRSLPGSAGVPRASPDAEPDLASTCCDLARPAAIDWLRHSHWNGLNVVLADGSGSCLLTCTFKMWLQNPTTHTTLREDALAGATAGSRGTRCFKVSRPDQW